MSYVSESFPLLYFNMAGEMLYIIDQRLTAQSVEQSKADKVLNDITLAMFNAKLISEVFKPHNSITFALLRSIFEKLAHSSIMRLNEQSMNKLFDLMVMVVKYQLYACAKPSDLIVITDNHLASVLEMVSFSEETAELVSVVRNQFLFHYNNRFDLVQLQLMRYSLLNIMKDIHTRVSIFLREGIQNSDGTFVIPTDRVKVECECQIPGVIRYFKEPGNALERTETFDTETEYEVEDIRTTLGLNIYRKELNESTDGDKSPNALAATDHRNEIDLLAMLICHKSTSPGGTSNPDDHQFKFEFLEDQLTRGQSQEEKEQQLAEAKLGTEQDEVPNENNDSEISETKVEPNQRHLLDIINDLNSLDLKRDIKTIDGATEGDSKEEDEEEVDYLELMDS